MRYQVNLNGNDLTAGGLSGGLSHISGVFGFVGNLSGSDGSFHLDGPLLPGRDQLEISNASMFFEDGSSVRAVDLGDRMPALPTSW